MKNLGGESMKLRGVRSILFVFGLGFSSQGFAADAPKVDFVRDLQPVFEQKCYSCHSHQEGVKKAGYVFDDLDSFAKDIGPHKIVVPGSLSESDLLRLVTLPQSDRHAMPPSGKGESFTEKEVKLLRDWILAGAPLPNRPASGVAEMKVDASKLQPWKNDTGKVIKAEFLNLQNGQVYLRLEDGKMTRYPLSKLSPESRALARQLAGE